VGSAGCAPGSKEETMTRKRTTEPTILETLAKYQGPLFKCNVTAQRYVEDVTVLLARIAELEAVQTQEVAETNAQLQLRENLDAAYLEENSTRDLHLDATRQQRALDLPGRVAAMEDVLAPWPELPPTPETLEELDVDYYTANGGRSHGVDVKPPTESLCPICETPCSQAKPHAHEIISDESGEIVFIDKGILDENSPPLTPETVRVLLAEGREMRRVLTERVDKMRELPTTAKEPC